MGEAAMMTIFNRAQLCVTQNLEQYANITAALNAAGIRYYSKALSRSSPAVSAMGTRERTGTFAQDMAYDYFYRIYVRKDDFEAAGECLRKALR